MHQHHMTAEDIYRQLLEHGDEIGLATVYRVLTQFEAAGLVLKHNFEGGQAVYELDRGGHHDHMVDVDSGKIIEFESPRSRSCSARSPPITATSWKNTRWCCTCARSASRPFRQPMRRNPGLARGFVGGEPAGAKGSDPRPTPDLQAGLQIHRLGHRPVAGILGAGGRRRRRRRPSVTDRPGRAAQRRGRSPRRTGCCAQPGIELLAQRSLSGW
jgi:Fe2+ or Zn2+ uptake regulation protein